MTKSMTGTTLIIQHLGTCILMLTLMHLPTLRDAPNTVCALLSCSALYTRIQTTSTLMKSHLSLHNNHKNRKHWRIWIEIPSLGLPIHTSSSSTHTVTRDAQTVTTTTTTTTALRIRISYPSRSCVYRRQIPCRNSKYQTCRFVLGYDERFMSRGQKETYIIEPWPIWLNILPLDYL